MSSYILEVQEDDNGDNYIILPDEVIEDLDWQEGDVLNWDVKGEGIILTKVNDPTGYVVLEE
jgi:bifunctional DNA-binding transcriptional regulator/antitoxin component of YhaV-PrlF toxin-antitoxin module